MIRRAAEVNAAVATGAVPVSSLSAPARRQAGPPPGLVAPRSAPTRPDSPARGLDSPTRGLDARPAGAPAPREGDGGVTRAFVQPSTPTEVAVPAVRPAEVEPEAQPDEQEEQPGSRSRRGRRYRDAASVDGSATVAIPTADKKAKRGRRRKSNFWRELPILIVVALLLTFLIQTFVARVYEIPSGSMETTLHGCSGCENDRVLVDKLSYRFGSPSPGDVVVFAGPAGWQEDGNSVERSSNPILRGLQDAASLIGLAPPVEEDFIKRVIATAGQTVSCCDAQNRVMVDGKPLNEPYIYYVPDVQPQLQEKFGPVVVPPGQLWMMGDSRNNSKDSRFIGQGPVPISDVIGKARFVVLPVSRIKSVPDTNPQEVSLSAGTGPTAPTFALGLLGAVPLTFGGRRLTLRRRRRRSAARAGSARPTS